MTAQHLVRNQSAARWWIIDGTDLITGRLAAQIARVIMGKHKPCYAADRVMGDPVIVTNVSKVHFTGRKWEQKVYRHHTGHPGGLKTTQVADLEARKPGEALRRAVYGMLPKNSLRDDRIKLLKLYPGQEHPHSSQNPQIMPLSADVCKMVKVDGSSSSSN